MTDLTQTQIETLTDNLDLTEDDLDSMDEDTLATIVSNLDTGGDGREDITTTTARQIAFARVLTDSATYDGEPVDVDVFYGPDTPEDEELDDDATVLSIDNDSYPGRREGWRFAVVQDLARAVSGGNGAAAFKFLSENQTLYQDLSMESSRSSIKEVLSDNGHPADAVVEEFDG